MTFRTIFKVHGPNFDLNDDLKSLVHPPLWKSSLFWLAVTLGVIMAIGLIFLGRFWPAMQERWFAVMWFTLGTLNLFAVWVRTRRCHKELQQLFDGGELARTPADPILQRLVVIASQLERQLPFALIGAMWLVMAFGSLFHLP